jgi:transcriptional regulator with XRE-family HTH domain
VSGPCQDGEPDDSQALAAARKARGLTQRELALQAAVSLSLLRKIEQGDRPLSLGTRVALERVLGPLTAASPGMPARKRVSAAIPALRDVMNCYDQPPELPAGPRPLAALREAVTQATRLRLESRYAELAVLLPGLIPEVTAAAACSSGNERPRAYGLLALAYRAADAIADKHGYEDLSGRAVELTRWAAARSGDPVLVTMAAYVRAELFFTGARAKAGLRILDDAVPARPAAGDHLQLAMYGAIQMRAAVLAARAGLPGEAADRMAEARAAADALPDGIYCGTAFGPGSVRVHELAAAAESGDTGQALQLITGWQPPLALPAERRSHFHIEAARIYQWAGDTGSAIASLLQARHDAPQHTRSNPAAACTTQALMRARRRPPPELLQFASWLGQG